MLVSWPLNRLMVAGVTNAAVTGVSRCTRAWQTFYGVGQGAALGFLCLLSVDAAVFALGLRAHGIRMALHGLLGIEAMRAWAPCCCALWLKAAPVAGRL